MPIRATGKVMRLYANSFGAYIALDNKTLVPKEGYFRLLLSHANYNSLYSLALAAAANRWPLQVRVAGSVEINPNVEAEVGYLVVDWNA